MRDRIVVIPIDDILAMFRDYFPEGDIPRDTQPTELRINPQERKVMIVAESRDWVKGMPHLQAKFELRRFHSVS